MTSPGSTRPEAARSRIPVWGHSRIDPDTVYCIMNVEGWCTPLTTPPVLGRLHMIAVHLFAPSCGYTIIEETNKPVTSGHLDEVIAEIREAWNEEPEGAQLFWLVDEAEVILATLLRDKADPEV